MKYVCIIAVALACAGCSVFTPPERYVPSSNYGDGGKTPCGTIQEVECNLPWCRK